MKRFLFVAFPLIALVACKLPEEKGVLKSLPALEGQIQFADLVKRAESEVALAIEAFFVDQYHEVDLAAQGLEGTARFLARAQDVPLSLKPLLPAEADKIGEEAHKLSEAARAKDAKEITPLLGRLHLRIRSLKTPN